jgi:hypothetical protein
MFKMIFQVKMRVLSLIFFKILKNKNNNFDWNIAWVNCQEKSNNIKNNNHKNKEK